MAGRQGLVDGLSAECAVGVVGEDAGVACVRFQNGAETLSQSMRKAQASSAAVRCEDAVPTNTMRAPTGSVPWRWITVMPSSGQRAAACAMISAICRCVIAG